MYHQDRSTLFRGCLCNKGDSVNSHCTPHQRLARDDRVAIHAHLGAAVLCEIQEEAAGLRAFVAQRLEDEI